MRGKHSKRRGKVKVKRVDSANMYCVTEKLNNKGKESFKQTWFSDLVDAVRFSKGVKDEQDNV